mgnify:CR=1 FL=1
MSYEQFRQYMDQYRQELQDNDKGDWSEEAREWATKVGLFAGNGSDINGEPNYMWQDFLTREQPHSSSTASPRTTDWYERHGENALLIAGLVLILVGMGLTGFWSRASMSRKSKPDLTQFSKWVVADVRPLLWVVTIGGFALASTASTRGSPAPSPGSALWWASHGPPTG